MFICNSIIYGQSIAGKFEVEKNNIFKDKDFKEFMKSKAQSADIHILKQQWQDLETLVGIDSLARHWKTAI